MAINLDQSTKEVFLTSDDLVARGSKGVPAI